MTHTIDTPSAETISVAICEEGHLHVTLLDADRVEIAEFQMDRDEALELAVGIIKGMERAAEVGHA